MFSKTTKVEFAERGPCSAGGVSTTPRNQGLVPRYRMCYAALVLNHLFQSSVKCMCMWDFDSVCKQKHQQDFLENDSCLTCCWLQSCTHCMFCWLQSSTHGMFCWLQRLANVKASPNRFISANLPVNKFKNRLVNILPCEWLTHFAAVGLFMIRDIVLEQWNVCGSVALCLYLCVRVCVCVCVCVCMGGWVDVMYMWVAKCLRLQ